MEKKNIRRLGIVASVAIKSSAFKIRAFESTQSIIDIKRFEFCICIKVFQKMTKNISCINHIFSLRVCAHSFERCFFFFLFFQELQYKNATIKTELTETRTKKNAEINMLEEQLGYDDNLY